jgi:hypothetical protein
MKVDDVLEHYGILGMKWGVRRDRAKLRKLARQRGETRDWDTASEDFKQSRVAAKKKLSQMSNDELKVLNQRLQLEKQYKELKKAQLTKGRSYVTKLLKSQGELLINSFIQQQGASLMKQLLQ